MISKEAPPVIIRLLGAFEVRRGECVLKADDWPRKKAAALLKRLALERRLLKDQAIENLWPDAGLASGANNLYKTLHVIRRTLNAALGHGTAEATLRFEDSILTLMPSVWVDVEAFEQLCAAPTDVPQEQRMAELKQVLNLYQGDLLPDDRYTEWTLIPREALYRRQHSARLELAGYHRRRGEYAEAIALLTPLLEHDPADEPIHRELMRIYALAGQRYEALRQYQACEEALAAELDVSPAPETAALYSQILTGEISSPRSPAQATPVSSTRAVLESETSGPITAVPAPPSAEEARPLFVGRERELNLLHSHLQAAVAGNGRIIFITGEAGQGKTSLMVEFAYRSLSQYPELVVAAGSCQAIRGIGDPYLPFSDLLAMLSGDWQRTGISGGISAALAQRLLAIAPLTKQAINALAPDVADTILPAALQTNQPAPGSRGLHQSQIFDQMRQLLHTLSQHYPLLLLLDDLQWTDTASANLLFHLGRQLVNSQVMIVGAYRPSEVSIPDSVHSLAPVVQELIRYRGDIQLDLSAVVPEEGRSFVDALLDSEPNRLNSSFREALYRRTKGQPLFTVELLQALKEQGDLQQDSLGMWTALPDLDWGILPARVEAVIARRVNRLPQELRQLLAAASVEGESFSVEVLAQVQGITVKNLLHQLSQELDHRYRLVREQGELHIGSRHITRYGFRHSLFQQYLYQQLSGAERRYLHGEIAAALEKLSGEAQDSQAVSLAYHYMAAGDAARAVPHLCRAGDDARRRVALEEAIQFYQSAITNWPEENGHTQELSIDTQAEVLQKLGESLLAVGKSSEAIERLNEAEQRYAQAGNRTGRGAVHRLIGRSYWEQGERARALNHYHQAMALLEQEPEGAELARAISAVSQMHALADELDEAIAWGERALALSQKLQQEDVLLHALVNLGMSLVGKGETERGLDMLVESRERAVAAGLPHDACRAFTALGDSLLDLERYEEARSVYERLLAYARKVQAGMFEGVALVQLGYLDWWTGRWGAALTRGQEISEWMDTSTGSSIAKIWASTFLGGLYNDLGQPERARAVLSGYTTAARSAYELQTTVPHLGQLARAAQSEEERAELMQEMLAMIDAGVYLRYDTLPALRLVCAWLAQTSGGAITALARLEKVHQQLQNRQSTALLHETRAFAAEIRGEWRQAIQDYEAAVENWQALQRPYDLLRALAGLVRVLSQTTDSAALRAVHRQAILQIEQLADGLADPELKRAFLDSPLVVEIRRLERLL